MIKRKAKRVQSISPAKKQTALEGYGFEMPPDIALVVIYFDQKGFMDQAALFHGYYSERNWSSQKGTPYRNWKVLASDWLFDHEQTLKLEKRLRENS